MGPIRTPKHHWAAAKPWTKWNGEVRRVGGYEGSGNGGEERWGKEKEGKEMGEVERVRKRLHYFIPNFSFTGIILSLLLGDKSLKYHYLDEILKLVPYRQGWTRLHNYKPSLSNCIETAFYNQMTSGKSLTQTLLLKSMTISPTQINKQNQHFWRSQPHQPGLVREYIKHVLTPPKCFGTGCTVLPLERAENLGNQTLSTLNPHNSGYPWANPSKF